VSAPVVVKIGGSLSERPPALRRLMRTLAVLARGETLVIVPGGGPFADEVRRADRRFALGDSPAHWMAILAMDQYAYLLATLARRATLVRRPRDITDGRLNVLAPSGWLQRADPLPHTWDVTSDTIAAWVAVRIRARLLILVKDVDGVFDVDPKRAPAARLQRRVPRRRLRGVVDGHFHRMLTPRTPCWVVNGRRLADVGALIATGRAYGTEVV